MRWGAALPATLFALTMTSAMAVGGLYASRRHVASSAENAAATSLLPAAERGLVLSVAAWDSASRMQQAIGSTEPLSGAPGTSVWVTRTAELEYLLVAEAVSVTRPPLHHRIALSVVIDRGVPRLAFPRAWTQLP